LLGCEFNFGLEGAVISSFPLMAIMLIAYNVLVFGLGIYDQGWQSEIFAVDMVSGVT